MSTDALVQLSYVVPDLDDGMRQWLRTGTTGPFLVMRRVSLPVHHRGRPAPVDLSIGFAQMGPVHVELVQQHNDGPSVFRERHDNDATALHHLGFLVNDFDEAHRRYAAAGFDAAMELEYDGTPMAYFDTHTAIGAMTELIQDDESIRALYRQISEAAAGWDGSDPVREL